ncbi:hypothetical protein P3X83_04795 [Spongiactinospora sp. TRM90649]|nr:hypothetical protein [Spongiactinospora sp. TRM90649]
MLPASSDLLPIIRALISPPGIVMLPIVALTGLLVLASVSLPGGSFDLLLPSMFLVPCAAALWLARFAAALAHLEGRRGIRRHWIRWAAAPVMGVAVIGLVLTGTPMDARFALSRPSLDTLVQDVTAGPTPAVQPDQRAGLYSLTGIERTATGVRFLIRDTGFYGSQGFAWSPGGPPPREDDSFYTHYQGPWYRWEVTW